MTTSLNSPSFGWRRKSKSAPVAGALGTQLLLTLLLAFLMPPPSMVLGQLLDCYSTLAELRSGMQAEFMAVVVQNDPVRPSPYVYTLCPHTTFEVRDKDVDIILPVLDHTVIQCGLDGSSRNACVVDEDGLGPDEPEVLLIPTEISDLIRFSTIFQGITFTNSKGWSVAAYDESPAQAMFLDCHWKNNSGKSIIHIQPQELPPMVQIGLEGMLVSLEDCVFENEQLSLGSGEVYNASLAALRAPIIVVASTLLMNNVTIRDSTVNYAVFSKFGRVYIENSKFEEIDAFDTILIMFGFCVLVNNYFGKNQNLISTIEVVDSGINVSLCEFENNHGLSDILALDEGRDGNRASLAFVQNSCFERGQYEMGPIFVAGNETSFQVVNNHVQDTDQEAMCLTSTFMEPSDRTCLNPENGLLLDNVDCLGTCVRGGFDASGCPRTASQHFEIVPVGERGWSGPLLPPKPTFQASRSDKTDSESGSEDGFCGGSSGSFFCIVVPIFVILGSLVVGLVYFVPRMRSRKEHDFHGDIGVEVVQNAVVADFNSSPSPLSSPTGRPPELS